jgi:hypothetical protein
MLWFLLACATDPDAPPDIPYDHVSCDHCAMLVSDPESASALVLDDGTTRTFDDPGCLMQYLVAEHPSVRHMWFHHGGQWFDEHSVAFLAGTTVTPMGSGLVAVAAGTPGALSIGEASTRLLGGGK